MVGLDTNTVNDVALVVLGVIGLYTARKTAAEATARKLAAEAAAAAATAAKTAQDKTATDVSVVKHTTEAIHVLSNSAMAAQLTINVQLAKSNAVMAHRLAEITKQPGDFAAASAIDLQVKEHEALLQTHLVQQAKLDAQKEEPS